MPGNRSCPKCTTFAGAKPLECLIKANQLQRIADWVFPEFKARDDALREKLLALYQRPGEKPSELPESPVSQVSDSKRKEPDINFEFTLTPFPDEDVRLVLPSLPIALKLSTGERSILSVKKHLHNRLCEPVDNIEILCKNFPLADSHSLKYIHATKWQNKVKTMELQYKRKKHDPSRSLTCMS